MPNWIEFISSCTLVHRSVMDAAIQRTYPKCCNNKKEGINAKLRGLLHWASIAPASNVQNTVVCKTSVMSTKVLEPTRSAACNDFHTLTATFMSIRLSEALEQ